MIRIYPYAGNSRSIRELRKNRDQFETGMSVMLRKNSRYRYRAADTIINWGATRLPEWYTGQRNIVNHPSAIQQASDKRATFQRLDEHGVPTPDYCLSYDEYLSKPWEGAYARTRVSSHSGRGIVLLPTTRRVDVRDCQLFTERLDTANEYRFHVGLGEVFDIQQKKLRKVAKETGDYSTTIRNHGNGWIYARKDLTPYPDSTPEIAVNAIKALGLDFGAVDIVITKDDSVKVLEINTAPGLTRTTVINYINFFNKLEQQWQ